MRARQLSVEDEWKGVRQLQIDNMCTYEIIVYVNATTRLMYEMSKKGGV
jgi:hypothetical protein